MRCHMSSLYQGRVKKIQTSKKCLLRVFSKNYFSVRTTIPSQIIIRKLKCRRKGEEKISNQALCNAPRETKPYLDHTPKD